jgi:hypothetical protein
VTDDHHLEFLWQSDHLQADELGPWPVAVDVSVYADITVGENARHSIAARPDGLATIGAGYERVRSLR